MTTHAVVDTCGWIEFAIGGPLADRFHPHLQDLPRVIVPTVIQFELFRWGRRVLGESDAIDLLALTNQADVRPLTSEIALFAAELAQSRRLAMADAMIYAYAQYDDVPLVTCDRHFADLPGVRYYPKAGS